jgi:hypothetical protein
VTKYCYILTEGAQDIAFLIKLLKYDGGIFLWLDFQREECGDSAGFEYLSSIEQPVDSKFLA